MKKYILLTGITTTLALPMLQAQTTTLTLQPNAVNGKDATIIDYPYANTTNGTDENFIANAWTSNGSYLTERSLVEFDLSNIPSNATILSASLSLYCNTTSSHTQRHSWYPGSPYSSNEATIRRITGTWQENTVTWNNQPATTTQNQLSLAPSTSATQDYTNMDVTAMVTDMHGNPATSHGFMIQLQTESIYRSLIFASSDHSDSTKRPKLVVTYRPAVGETVTNVANIGSALKVSPNPAHGTITIQAPQSLTGTARTVVVIDAMGREILKGRMSDGINECIIDISSLSKGLYMVRINDGAQFLTSKMSVN